MSPNHHSTMSPCALWYAEIRINARLGKWCPSTSISPILISTTPSCTQRMLHAELTTYAHIHTHLASRSILLLYSVMRTSPHHDVGVILAGNSAVGAVMGWGVFLFDITHSDGYHPHWSAIAFAIPGKVFARFFCRSLPPWLNQFPGTLLL